jgi:flavin reductase (DIM6/NTAB) family NADH-FMN oxidoreductase RutF
MEPTPIERVMGEMPYGLYIIGSKEDGDRVNGMMADWVMQVSFDPRLVAVSFENNSHTLANIRARPHFSVNLLEQNAEAMDLVRPFAQPYSGAKVAGREGPEAEAVHYKLDGVACWRTDNGCPVLEAALAWFECQAEQFLALGDHTLVVGRVLDGRMEREGDALTACYTGWHYSG